MRIASECIDGVGKTALGCRLAKAISIECIEETAATMRANSAENCQLPRICHYSQIWPLIAQTPEKWLISRLYTAAYREYEQRNTAQEYNHG